VIESHFDETLCTLGISALTQIVLDADIDFPLHGSEEGSSGAVTLKDWTTLGQLLEFGCTASEAKL